jgi:hypothetical protein
MRKHSLQLILLLLVAGGVSARANTYNPILDETFLGWNHDSSLLAYQRAVGYMSMDEPDKEWSATYIVVSDAHTGKVRDRFQVKATTSTAKLNSSEWKIYTKAKTADEWAQFSSAQTFKKPDAEVISGDWTLTPSLSGRGAVLKTAAKVASGYDGEVESTIRTVPGKVLTYRIEGPQWMNEWGTWKLSFDVKNSRKTVSISTHRLMSGKDMASGYPEGFFAAFWAPDRQSVALEWTYWPMAGGGEWTEFYRAALPK